MATLMASHMIAEDVKSLTFRLASWQAHKSGQHYDIRLTAANGYQAERKYSVASAPEKLGEIEFGIQLLKNGEVSPYLFELPLGSQVEVRGPLGGHFIWETTMPGPLILIGGGSGMVPLVSMLRHAAIQRDTRPIIFLISARSQERILYQQELQELKQQLPNLQVVTTLTESHPNDWKGYTRRIDKAMLEETVKDFRDAMPMIYICGPTPFVETAATLLVELGFHSHQIRTERFGG